MTARDRLADWLFSTAILAYPRSFRDRFGGEMRADFHRSRTSSVPGTLRSLCALLHTGLAERGTAIHRVLSASGSSPHLYHSGGRSFMLRDTFLSDLRHALRLVRKSPVVTGLAVLALALGIGANSAIFTVVNAVLLRPLPYQSPDRLVMVWSDNTNEQRPQNPISPANYADLRDAAREVVHLEGFFSFIVRNRLEVDGPAEMVNNVYVSAGLFNLLGRQAALGRIFQDDEEGGVVLSHGLWQRRFGGDPTIIGRATRIESQPATIVGVMPPDFAFPYKGMLGPSGFLRSTEVESWTLQPLRGPRITDQAGQLVRNVHFFAAIGRLEPGATVEQARAALATAANRLAIEYPATNKGWGTTVVPAHEQVVGPVRPALVVLMSGVILILVMSCVNVANLVLARSVARQRELAVRAALGATSGRLMRQALVEGLLLGVAGGLFGLVFVRWGVQGLLALAPADLPRLTEVRPDALVVGATLGIGVLTGLIVGVIPAMMASRTDIRPALQEGSRGTIGSRARHRLRASLVVVEVALAVVLAVGAGLLMRSFVTLLDVDPGFRTENLLTMQMTLPDRLATPDQRRAFYQALFDRLRGLPSVVSVGGTTRIPLGSTNVSTSITGIEGRTLEVGQQVEAEFRRAMDDYFVTMGIPLVRGRAFVAEDGPTAPGVVIINQALATRLVGAGDPIGTRVRMGPDPSSSWSTIVGVVGDVRHSAMDRPPAPEIYVNYLTGPPVAPFIAIRTTGDPTAVAEQVRLETKRLEPALTVYDVRTMAQIQSESVAERRFLLLLIGLFGVLALTLAAVGVYGVMSLVVSERTQEMGVRLALGAAPSNVLALVLWQAAALAAVGIVSGLALAATAAPLLASQLFGVTARDPITFVGVPIVLLAIAALSALVPGRRAAITDPLMALRNE